MTQDKPSEFVPVDSKECWDIFQREWMKLVERDRALGMIADHYPRVSQQHPTGDQKTELGA